MMHKQHDFVKQTYSFFTYIVTLEEAFVQNLLSKKSKFLHALVARLCEK